mmetsp:Transcript_23737/g.42029  ORF Transcript_23737/g.42029 Transcript_23737/m.42029 type:complete len:345 (+) Transcript_23737:30-1064(+)
MKANLPRSFCLPSLDKLIIERIKPKDLFIALPVLCINCEEFIENELVDTHSSDCFKASKTLSEKEDRQDLDLNNQRLLRLHAFVKDLSQAVKVPSQKSILSVIVRLCKDTTEITNYLQLNDLDRNKDSIQASASRVEGSITVQVCADRFVALVEQRKAALAASLHSNCEDELTVLRNETQFFKERASKLETNLGHGSPFLLEKIESEAYSGRSPETSNCGSSIVSDYSEVRMSINELEDSPRKQTSNALKRMFYSTCLAVKLTFPQRHPAHRIPITQLYRLSLQEKVTIDKWKAFIIDYFASHTLEASIAERLEAKLKRSPTPIRTITESEELDTSFTVESSEA